MTNLITVEGLKKIHDEFDYLWKVERQRVVQDVSDAAAEGDRSEKVTIKRPGGDLVVYITEISVEQS